MQWRKKKITLCACHWMCFKHVDSRCCELHLYQFSNLVFVGKFLVLELNYYYMSMHVVGELDIHWHTKSYGKKDQWQTTCDLKIYLFIHYMSMVNGMKCWGLHNLQDICRLLFGQKVQLHNIYFHLSKGLIYFTAILIFCRLQRRFMLKLCQACHSLLRLVSMLMLWSTSQWANVASMWRRL